MNLHQERRYKPQSDAEQCPSESEEGVRRRSVIELRVESQQTASKETHQSEAKKEENALQISLTPMAQNHNHPEERQERSRRQVHKSEVGMCMHGRLRPSLQLPIMQGNYQVQENSGGRSAMKIKHLIIYDGGRICVLHTHIARILLDLKPAPAILAVGCEEC